MADFNVNHITGKQGQQGTVLAGVTTVSSTGSMRIPSGPTEQRGGRGRGLFAGGRTQVNTIEYITIASAGNATDFGDLTIKRDYPGGMGSPTRGLFAGGAEPGFRTVIDYTVISSKGGASDFGDLNIALFQNLTLSNTTRGVSGGGLSAPTPSYIYNNIVEYVTMATTGDATEYGDLVSPIASGSACASPTRGIFYCGSGPLSPYNNTIEYITIASSGDATDFGEAIKTGNTGSSGASSSTRGVFAGGQFASPYPVTNIIDYITIATTGNSVDFGDLTSARTQAAGMSSQTRACFAGGSTGSEINNIDYVTIATTGNAADFGDILDTRDRLQQGCSDVHGGLGE